MFRTAVRRAAEEKIPYIFTNKYKAQRAWPPDFSKLSPKYQFKLERKYKRRAKLAWARPRWTKGVKMVQMASVSFVLIYGVLFLDWKQENQPFQGVRDWFFGLTGSLWSKDRVRRRDPEDTPSSRPS